MQNHMNTPIICAKARKRRLSPESIDANADVESIVVRKPSSRAQTAKQQTHNTPFAGLVARSSFGAIVEDAFSPAVLDWPLLEHHRHALFPVKAPLLRVVFARFPQAIRLLRGRQRRRKRSFRLHILVPASAYVSTIAIEQ
jgi:hypothetical protein